MAKESPLDRHIYLHIHEIMPGRWLQSRNRIRRNLYKILAVMLLGIAIIGALWFQWWR